MAKSSEAITRKKKYRFYLMGAGNYFVCVYCEVVQKLKNGSNHDMKIVY
jgi:hypothetical protein